MHRKILASSHQHLMAEAPSISKGLSFGTGRGTRRGTIHLRTVGRPVPVPWRPAAAAAAGPRTSRSRRWKLVPISPPPSWSTNEIRRPASAERRAREHCAMSHLSNQLHEDARRRFEELGRSLLGRVATFRDPPSAQQHPKPAVDIREPRPFQVLPPSSVATPYLNANVSWPACVGERH